MIGRKKEIEKVIQVLSRRTKNNPVLIGEPGVGKSAIAEGLSQLIVNGEVPEQLFNKTVFSVDIPGMLAGARYRGDFEERLKDLTEAVMKDGDIILFIDEIHTIVGAGSSADNTMDAANILKPMLARGDLQVIGATTIEEYRKYIEKDSALERRFTPVYVEEPSESDTVSILKGLRPKYEEHHGIEITDAAIEAAVKLSSAISRTVSARQGDRPHRRGGGARADHRGGRRRRDQGTVDGGGIARGGRAVISRPRAVYGGDRGAQRKKEAGSED